MLKADNISVNYGKMSAVRGVNFKVYPGEFVAILGSNGAGKTTILKALMGLLSLHTGRVIFNGEDISKKSTAERIRTGLCLVPEGRQVIPGMTIEENLRLAYLISHLGKQRNLEGYKGHLENLFALFPKLKERLNQRAGSLSGGEQQMLAIARGLITEPKLLMLDEPSLGLAPIIVDQFFEVLTKLNRAGLTVIIVEQDVHRAIQVSHRGYILESGTITFEGDTKTLQESDIVKTAFLGI